MERNRDEGINEEILDTLIKKVTDLEKNDKNTDYTLHYEALKKIIEAFLTRYNKDSAALIDTIGRLNIEYPADQIQTALAEIKIILTAIQKSLPVKVVYQLDVKSKSWIIAGIILLIVTVMSTCLCGFFWTENNSLQIVDVKYRLEKQIDPAGSKWADSIYNINPEKAEKMLRQIENGEIKITGASNRKKGSDSKRRSRRRVKK